MSYATIRSNSRIRFNENLTFLNYLTSEENKYTNPIVPLSLELNIMKGLFYVHLYSSLEKSINELIVGTLININSINVKNRHYSIPFNTISVLGKLQAFKDCGYKHFFSKAIEIFSEISSENIPTLNETAFSRDLQNVWAKTIIEILKAFGINYIIDPIKSTTIDEIVEKRNAVAHGRESASTIGERFRTNDLRARFTIVSEFNYELIDLFESYYNDKKFLKPQSRRVYLSI